MNQFRTYPIKHKWPLCGTISMAGGAITEIECHFKATQEYEIDTMVMALLHLRGLLRENYRPLPRNRSMVAR